MDRVAHREMGRAHTSGLAPSLPGKIAFLNSTNSSAEIYFISHTPSEFEMASKKRKEAPSKEHAPPEKKHKYSQPSSQIVLKPEELAFPRGGASVLTPLEHKRIQIQAKNDVLFEQAT
ncbi:MAG: hypothetical protein Q9214_007609 [Letrouitia sp. 1 TL-2023]